MEVRYVAEFKVSEQMRDDGERQPTETNQVIAKERKFDAKVIGKGLATGVAITAVASRIYAQLQSTANSITGDSVSQRRLDNRMAYLNEGLQLAGTLGIVALVNPATLPLAAAGLAVSYGFRAFQTAQHNQVTQAGWLVESKINAQRQSRLVRDITGVRI